MASQPRYRHAFEHADDPHRFVEEVAKAKWGTDPNYASHLQDLIVRHDLTRYDVPRRSAEAPSASESANGQTPAAAFQKPRVAHPTASSPWEHLIQPERGAAAANVATAAELAGQQAPAPVQRVDTPTMRKSY